MPQIVATLFMLGIPLALLALIVTSAIKVVRHAGFKALIALVVTIVAVSKIAWKHYELRHALQALPAVLEVSEMVYAKEENWGIGLPGDNETGVRVFPLKAEVAQRIEEDGPCRPQSRNDDAQESRAQRRQYADWQPTPMPAQTTNGEGELVALRLDTYLDRYGFGIPVDPDIEGRVNAIIESPGSCYTRLGTGTLLISPRERLVVFMYAG